MCDTKLEHYHLH